MSAEQTRTEIFSSFVGTRINDAATPDDAMVASGVCITAWNVAHEDERSIADGIARFVKRIGRDMTSRYGSVVGIDQYVREMIDLKRQSFEEHRFRVTKAKFEMDENGNTTIVID